MTTAMGWQHGWGDLRGWGRGRWAAVAVISLVLAGSVVAVVTNSGGTTIGDDRSYGDDATEMVEADSSLSKESTMRPGSGSAGGATETAAGAPAPSVAADSSAPASLVPGLDAKVVQTAALRVRVDDGAFAKAWDRAASIIDAAGGTVARSSTASFEEGSASGELTARVPTASFDDVRRSFAGLGERESEDRQGEEVSGQLVDLEARLRTMRAEEGSLQELLRNAKGLGEILQVRDRLTGVRTEIEQLAGQQASLEDRVAYATVVLSLHEGGDEFVAPTSSSDDPSFTRSLETAADAAVAVVGGMAVVLGAMSPFALLALAAWLISRRYRRSHAAAQAG